MTGGITVSSKTRYGGRTATVSALRYTVISVVIRKDSNDARFMKSTKKRTDTIKRRMEE